MKCFLRANSPEIRKKLEENGIKVCACCEFEGSEWISHSQSTPGTVHGVFPGDKEEHWWSEDYFGTKETFKDIFLENAQDHKDCGEDVDLFIKTISL